MAQHGTVPIVQGLSTTNSALTTESDLSPRRPFVRLKSTIPSENHAGEQQGAHESSVRLLNPLTGRAGHEEEFEVEEPQASGLRTKTTRQRYFSGRTVSLRFLASCVAVILLLNIGAFIYGWRKGHSSSGALLIAQASCKRVKRLDLGLHALINVLGILALAAVGAFLTVLSSPTRQDLNRAHAHGQWLDIGIPSIRNLKHIGKLRKWLCITLFVLSLPIHIM